MLTPECECVVSESLVSAESIQQCIFIRVICEELHDLIRDYVSYRGKRGSTVDNLAMYYAEYL
jgi:hypothetical protein